MGFDYVRPLPCGICHPALDGCTQFSPAIPAPCPMGILYGGRHHKLLFFETFRHRRGALLQSVCPLGREKKLSV